MIDGNRSQPVDAAGPPLRGPVRLLLGLLLVLALARNVGAAAVVLRISVVNPLDREQRKEVRSNLPAGIDVPDVLDTDGLELRYDVARDMYYVFTVVDLAPRQRVDYRITMRDVWTLPETELNALAQQATRLAGVLQDTAFETLANETAAEIQARLRALRENQARNAISAGARAVDHIRAHHVNREALAEIRNRVGELENLALGAGYDPGGLLGTLEHKPRPTLEKGPPEPDEMGEVIMRISVRNTSAENPRTVDLRRPLPREVRPSDVLEAEGLEIGVDPDRAGAVTVFFPGLELAPAETRTFEVRLRDRWNVHAPRQQALAAAANILLDRVRAMQSFPSVETYLEDVIAEIGALGNETPPAEIDDRYVAFFRAQGERLDQMAEKIGRVEASLRPGQREQRLGFDVPAPDPKTTWLVIYGILGFLGTVSLLFFLRWFGKGSSSDTASVVEPPVSREGAEARPGGQSKT